MKKLLLFAVLLAGCAKPPRITVTAQIRRTSAAAGKLVLMIKNVEDRPTTPLVVEASVQPPNGTPIRLIHPAPFVLNRRETREIIAPFVSGNADLSAVVVLKEGESGKLLQPASFQVLPTLPPQAPATPAPGTPQLRGK